MNGNKLVTDMALETVAIVGVGQHTGTIEVEEAEMIDTQYSLNIPSIFQKIHSTHPSGNRTFSNES